jgi:hypothetical protein
MLQILLLPVTADFTLAPMDEEEAAEREMRGRRIHASRETLAADSTWLSRTGTVFDGTYRHILRAAKAKEKNSSIKRSEDVRKCVLLHHVIFLIPVMVMKAAGTPRAASCHTSKTGTEPTNR